jgi:hypothetical protein
MILPPLMPIILAAHVIVTIADEVPYIDVTATCRAETAQMQASVQFCIQDEQRTHDRLVQEWAQFAASDEVTCNRIADNG